MLLRWLILRLCVTRAEMRVVMRSLRSHYASLMEEPDPRRTAWHLDRRITRSMRLSLLLGLLIVHVENPRLLAGALIAAPLAVLLLLFQLADQFR